MRGLRQWLSSVALLTGSAIAVAQTPGTLPAPIAQSSGLPGGTVVGSSALLPAKVGVSKAPIADVTVLRAEPVAAENPPPPTATPTLPPTKEGPIPGVAPILTPPTPDPVAAIFPQNSNDCCGPVGAHGPIGQEIFVRAGISDPRGDGLLAKNLKRGWLLQLGGRAQLFDTEGDAAWAIEPQFVYSFNKGTGEDITTFRGEPTKVSSLLRYGVGLGLGRDYFLSRPGFILDTWDANFRIGVDAGGRWGTGHVNLSPIFENDGYRRHHDVYGQAFAGLTATMEIPMGGYTALFGGRVEWDYTFSDFISKGSSFQEIDAMFMVGVRY